ncbi:MAG TPA: helicase-related protein [Caulobacteraceae bacterium]
MRTASWPLSPSRVVAVLGPTNTGKTHLAVERMLGHASGMIGLPLRLLAREIYDRIAKLRGAGAVALVTGEEKIIPPRAHYFVCTVEAMPLSREVEFLAVDEIQLAADPERGHVFTSRLVGARGRFETMFLGAQTMAPLIRKLLPGAEVTGRERLSKLDYAGSRKLTRLPRRSAIVAFSAEEVYAIAELIRRQRGGAAVVMGSLSPRTRNAQVALYQSGEVDFLVATDAIGMGLNMDVGHVGFAGLAKFDGKRRRLLHPHEIAQIAGRAGRHLSDGAFGETGACPPMENDVVDAVENHQFDPVAAAQWRNDELDFGDLGRLLASLALPPRRPGLQASPEALDERTLRTLASNAEIADRCAPRGILSRLWEACQTPDFRKTTFDDHVRLVRDLFDHLSAGVMRLPDDWMVAQFRPLDRIDGEIDTLSTRLAGVRTLAYVAHRPDWLADATHWQGETLRLEDRLSDTLHEKLMARFIDRRTSAILRGLGQQGDLLAGIAADGTVTVEGHFVGRLRGLDFEAARGAGALAQKALRAAAQRAAAPEVARRLGAVAADPDECFAVTAEGEILWRGEVAAVLAGAEPFAPRVRLLGELGPEPARARAARRLEAFVAGEAGRRLAVLKRLNRAVGEGAVKGLARGLAWRLEQAGGVLARREVEDDVRVLSRAERRTLRALGVRIGAYSLFLPGQFDEADRSFARAFALQTAPGWRPVGPGPHPLAYPPPPDRALSLRGLLRVGSLAVDVRALEKLDEVLRVAPRGGAGRVVSTKAMESIGWTVAEAEAILRALGYRRQSAPGEPATWRRARAEVAPYERIERQGVSPFAALSTLELPARPGRRRAGPAKSRRGRG